MKSSLCVCVKSLVHNTGMEKRNEEIERSEEIESEKRVR